MFQVSTWELAPLLDRIAEKLDVVIGRLGDIATLLDVPPDPPRVPQWGRTLVATTGRPVVIGTAAVEMAVLIALPTNSTTVVVGNNSVGQTTGYPLQAGAALGVAVDNMNMLSVNGTAGDGVAWVGT